MTERQNFSHEYLHEHGIGHSHAHAGEETGADRDRATRPASGASPGSGSHHHVHSEEEKRAVLNRLSRAIGHLESVKRMIERDEDCSDVLIQLAAVRNAINNTGKVIMKGHISHCIVDAIEADDMAAVEALNKAIDRFIK